jgi:hypothetical protein
MDRLLEPDMADYLAALKTLLETFRSRPYSLRTHNRRSEGRQIVDPLCVDVFDLGAYAGQGYDQSIQYEAGVDPGAQNRLARLLGEAIQLIRQLRLGSPRKSHLLRDGDYIRAVLKYQLYLRNTSFTKEAVLKSTTSGLA